MNIKYRIGQKVGRLTLLERLTGGWRCLCSCGRTRFVRSNNLCQIRSCGCLISESGKKIGLANTRHGGTNTPEFRAWQAMIQRCHNPKTRCFKNYGGRGIAICTEWQKSFERFLLDMGRRPSVYHSLDRVNNDGNYEPSNCRWATASQQNINRRPQNRRKNITFKLPADTREQIHSLQDTYSHRKLGRMFGVTHKTIARIIAVENTMRHAFGAAA